MEAAHRRGGGRAGPAGRVRVALDHSGNLVVADVYSVAVDPHGNVLLADIDNSRVRAVAAHTGTYYGVKMTAGDVSTVAGNGVREFAGDGGPATAAGLNLPQDAAPAANGGVLIADTDNSRIREVTG